MELDKCIVGRKSIRSFKSNDVDHKLIAECLNAARYAPSAGNSQNWKFIVISDKSLRSQVVKLCDDNEWMVSAPVLIVVCSDLSKITKFYGSRGEALYSIQGVAASIQNLLLKAHDLGLSSCWVGTFDEVELSRILNIPGDARPQAIICLGYSKLDEESIGREPLDNFVFYGSWGNRLDNSRSAFPLSKHIDHHLEKIKDKIHESFVKKK